MFDDGGAFGYAALPRRLPIQQLANLRRLARVDAAAAGAVQAAVTA